MKRTKYTRFICLALSAILAFGLTGCGNKSSENKIGVITFDDIDKLADGGYYIRHGDVYYQPYFGQTSFTPDRTVTAKDDKSASFIVKVMNTKFYVTVTNKSMKLEVVI